MQNIITENWTIPFPGPGVAVHELNAFYVCCIPLIDPCHLNVFHNKHKIDTETRPLHSLKILLKNPFEQCRCLRNHRVIIFWDNAQTK